MKTASLIETNTATITRVGRFNTRKKIGVYFYSNLEAVIRLQVGLLMYGRSMKLLFETPLFTFFLAISLFQVDEVCELNHLATV